MKTLAPAWRLAYRGLLALLLPLYTGSARAEDSLELRVKSAFLFNFANFISWPDSKLAGPADPVWFCLLERDTLGPVLEATIDGKSVDGHPLQVRYVDRMDALRDCELAYLGVMDASRLPALEMLRGSGVLSVYDSEVTQSPGIVRFFLEERRVRFEINQAAAEREGLQVSSRLMGVAKVVRE